MLREEVIESFLLVVQEINANYDEGRTMQQRIDNLIENQKIRMQQKQYS